MKKQEQRQKKNKFFVTLHVFNEKTHAHVETVSFVVTDEVGFNGTAEFIGACKFEDFEQLNEFARGCRQTKERNTDMYFWKIRPYKVKK